MNVSLAKKLLKFQQKVTAITKELENPYYKSVYFDVNAVINVIKPILSECELIVLQPLTSVDGKPAIKTYIIDAETGEQIWETSPITELPKAQEMGASITYFRRYALVSMLLLTGEVDDDANSISIGTQKTSKVITPATIASKPTKPTVTKVEDL